MSINPLKPRWYSWQAGVWAFGEADFLQHMSRFWTETVLDKASPPYDSRCPGAGHWPEAMAPLGGFFDGVHGFSGGLHAIRPDNDLDFFERFSSQMEAAANLASFNSPSNLCLLAAHPIGMPAQYEAKQDAGVMDPEPKSGFLLLSSQFKVVANRGEFLRTFIQLVSTDGVADKDVYAPETLAAMVTTWAAAVDAKPSSPDLSAWSADQRAKKMNNGLPDAVPSAPKPRF